MANLTYFKKFDTKSDYDAYIDGTPVLPNVSIVANEDVYFKDSESPEPPHDYSQDYLTFVMLEDGGGIEANVDGISFSKDGETWVEEMTGLTANDKVFAKGNVKKSSATWSWFNVTNNRFFVEGNVMSIYDADGFRTRTTFDSPEDNLAYLFKELYGLTSAKNLILPATTLTENCYYNMFNNCASLTEAPELPATTLGDACYGSMFQYCSSLTTAPELPTTTLAEGCYWGMFESCTNLNYIKCLATDISASDCTSGWVYDVSPTGTFVKAASMTDWTAGNDGIPDGWTVQDA